MADDVCLAGAGEKQYKILLSLLRITETLYQTQRVLRCTDTLNQIKDTEQFISLRELVGELRTLKRQVEEFNPDLLLFNFEYPYRRVIAKFNPKNATEALADDEEEDMKENDMKVVYYHQ